MELPEDGQAVLDLEATGGIGLGVDAELGTGRNDDVLVDDRVAPLGVAAEVDLTVAVTSAVVLGVALAAAGSQVAIVDLDLQFGDAAIMLGIEPEKTIYDLVVAPGELDTEKLAGYVTRHASGLDILPAPLRPEDAELVTEAKLAQLLEVARESYDVIVVDTSPFFHGPMLATLDRTDELLLICSLDVPKVAAGGARPGRRRVRGVLPQPRRSRRHPRRSGKATCASG